MKYVFLTPGMLVANWRTVWPAQELARRGYDTAYHHNGTEIPKLDPETETTFVLHFVNQGWVDDDGNLLTCTDIALQARERGRLVLQFDDDWTKILEIEPRPYRAAPLLLLRQLPHLVTLADRVIVATSQLKPVYQQWNSDVRVAMNFLPRSVFNLPHRPRRDAIAWMGVMDVHGRDWMQLRPYAKDLPPLRLVGSGEIAARVLRHWGAPVVEATDRTLDQDDLYQSIGEARAAIIPLRPSPFNNGKSWIKAMEFAARAVPPVVQSHPEYVRLNALVPDLVTIAPDAESLVAHSVDAYERGGGDDLPERLIDSGMTMEHRGGDAWERALVA